MSNLKPNKVTKKALKEVLTRTDFSETHNYEQFIRNQLSQQIIADLLEIAVLSNTSIPKMVADEKGIFRKLKT